MIYLRNFLIKSHSSLFKFEFEHLCLITTDDEQNGNMSNTRHKKLRHSSEDPNFEKKKNSDHWNLHYSINSHTCLPFYKNILSRMHLTLAVSYRCKHTGKRRASQKAYFPTRMCSLRQGKISNTQALFTRTLRTHTEVAVDG